MIYFTSDLHLGHANVLRLSDRPWSDIDEMNRALINNINATVGYHDELYMLGDFSFRIPIEEASELLNKIQCQNLYLIRGNHDKDWARSSVGHRWKEICDYKELKVAGICKFCLMHYPLLEWNGSRRHYSINLHGHQHNLGPEYNLTNFDQGIMRYDVGVDANDYKPVSADEIISLAGLKQEADYADY